jgi:hypothetical protein
MKQLWQHRRLNFLQFPQPCPAPLCTAQVRCTCFLFPLAAQVCSVQHRHVARSCLMWQYWAQGPCASGLDRSRSAESSPLSRASACASLGRGHDNEGAAVQRERLVVGQLLAQAAPAHANGSDAADLRIRHRRLHAARICSPSMISTPGGAACDMPQRLACNMADRIRCWHAPERVHAPACAAALPAAQAQVCDEASLASANSTSITCRIPADQPSNESPVSRSADGGQVPPSSRGGFARGMQSM